MKLDLEILPNLGPGRQPKPLTFEIDREITPVDLQLLATLPADASEPPPIKRLTDRHHMLARLLAGGMSEGNAAVATGYELSRVSILKNSPAFQELLSFYRKKEDEEFISVVQHMAGITLDALLELRDRLEEDPKEFSTKELLTIVNDMADRSGAPRQKEITQQVNINMGDRLEAARQRAKEAMRRHMIGDDSIIDVTPND